jgi:hypothetical protein
MGRYSFAWVADDNSAYLFSKCREVIAETFMQHLNKNSGYALLPKPSLEKTRLLVAYTDKKDLGLSLERALDFLHQIESQLGLIHTTMDQVEGLSPTVGTVYLIEGSKRWTLSSPMLSLYMLILRNGDSHTIGDPYTQTLINPLKFEIAADVSKMISFLIEKKYWKVFGKDRNLNWISPAGLPIIPYAGMSYFMAMKPNAIFPHWQIYEEKVNGTL